MVCQATNTEVKSTGRGRVEGGINFGRPRHTDTNSHLEHDDR